MPEDSRNTSSTSHGGLLCEVVKHWQNERENKHRHVLMAINGTGAIATGVTTIIVLIAKFTSGAWVTALLIPTLILLMVGVKQHYTRVKREVGMGKLNLSTLQEPLVVIPMARWDRMTERFGRGCHRRRKRS